MLLLLSLAVQLPQSALPAQNRPVLVVHQIEMGAVSNVNARERVYNAVSSAFVLRKTGTTPAPHCSGVYGRRAGGAKPQCRDRLSLMERQIIDSPSPR